MLPIIKIIIVTIILLHYILVNYHCSVFKVQLKFLMKFCFLSEAIVYRYIARAKSEISQKLVGSSGLEPPTSRLSGVRSNHLSYEPMLVYVGLLVLCPTCGGDEQNRTVDPLLAKQVLSQLSYTPIYC